MANTSYLNALNIKEQIVALQSGKLPVFYELSPVADSRKSYYGKARVVEWNGESILVSYETPVCKIDRDGRFVRLWNGYSATTMRHINSFLIFNGVNGGGKKWWMAQPVEVERRAI